MIDNAVTFLAAQRHAHMTHAVLYCQGPAAVALNATVAQTLFAVDREIGVETIESRDYLIRSSDLASHPQAGDRIRETVNGVEQVFEVSAPGDQDAWRWSGPGNLAYRVHTKRISE